MDKAKVFFIIRRYMQSKVPGYFEIMEAYCRKMYGKSCIDLFIDEPEKFREVLVKRYGNDVYSIYFAVKYLFLRPILLELNKLDLEEDLATLLLNNPRKFNDILKQILKSLG